MCVTSLPNRTLSVVKQTTSFAFSFSLPRTLIQAVSFVLYQLRYTDANGRSQRVTFATCAPRNAEAFDQFRTYCIPHTVICCLSFSNSTDMYSMNFAVVRSTLHVHECCMSQTSQWLRKGAPIYICDETKTKPKPNQTKSNQNLKQTSLKQNLN